MVGGKHLLENIHARHVAGVVSHKHVVAKKPFNAQPKDALPLVAKLNQDIKAQQAKQSLESPDTKRASIHQVIPDLLNPY